MIRIFETSGHVIYELLYIIDMSSQNQPGKRSEVTQTKDSGSSWRLILMPGQTFCSQTQAARLKLQISFQAKSLFDSHHFVF